MITIKTIKAITFRIRNTISNCYNSLLKDGYDYIEGDIRLTCSGKCCTLGYKHNESGRPIINIIRTLSTGREPLEFIQKDEDIK